MALCVQGGGVREDTLYNLRGVHAACHRTCGNPACGMSEPFGSTLPGAGQGDVPFLREHASGSFVCCNEVGRKSPFWHPTSERRRIPERRAEEYDLILAERVDEGVEADGTLRSGGSGFGFGDGEVAGGEAFSQLLHVGRDVTGGGRLEDEELTAGLA